MNAPSARVFALCGLLAAGLLAAPEGRARGAAFKADEVKAVFLFNFAKFVEWPPEAFSGPESPIVIGVLGADPFGADLDEAVSGETIGLRRVVVKRFARLQDLQPCHILYISSSEKARLPQVLSRLEGSSVLTVGEMDGFTAMGGIINLRVSRGRVRFDISKTAADQAGLKINAQLLRVARSERER